MKFRENNLILLLWVAAGCIGFCFLMIASSFFKIDITSFIFNFHLIVAILLICIAAALCSIAQSLLAIKNCLITGDKT